MLIIYLILGLALLILVLSMVTPKTGELEKTVFIDRPLDEVYNYVSCLKNQENWVKWFQADPGMEKRYQGEDGKIGYQISWNSSDKKIGSGQQTLTALEANKAVYSKLEFIRPYHSESNTYFRTEEAGNGLTILSWGFKAGLPRPSNVILMILNLDKRLGKGIEDSLNRLKEILEEKKDYSEEEQVLSLTFQVLSLLADLRLAMN